MTIHLECQKPIDLYKILVNLPPLGDARSNSPTIPLGLRTAKKVFHWNPKALSQMNSDTTQPRFYAWELISETYLLYDNWNLIAEFYKTSTQPKISFVKRTYLWRLNISGSLQSAGGVGELLTSTDHSTVKPTTYAAAYDDNGALVALGNVSNGRQSTRYQYNPFSQVLQANGPAAASHLFSFSTKYKDDETSLLYYGYLHYDPDTARWLSRDPIGVTAFLQQYAQGKDTYELATLEEVTLCVETRILPLDPQLGSKQCKLLTLVILGKL